ncbi:hypothetical protein [Mucilaginibacter ginkgonis]|uniref:Lipocalin-like protein n=1 Tax=Mucilaginibacter ginkgonis TaxID=2682091 RepID=A0A6I4IN71_9SPHI|nr:hypothetical protein [Mucilaginibacter ginkgonis]QQL51267.1 hypothetical protein GO620_007425 [Mucilaginibacter ginkgonis]
MLKIYTVILLCIVLLAGGCKKENPEPDPGPYIPLESTIIKGLGMNTPLTGKWDWVKAISGTFGTSNPVSTGIDEKVVFTNDSTMTIYHNNLYYYQFKYLYYINYKFGSRTLNMTAIGDSKYETVIKNDTLTFSTFEYGNYDQRIYVKLK